MESEDLWESCEAEKRTTDRIIYSILHVNSYDQLDDPFIYRDRNSAVPNFVARLFPGGEVEGWAIKEVPAGYSPVILRFNHILPGKSSSDWDERYFILEP